MALNTRNAAANAVNKNILRLQETGNTVFATSGVNHTYDDGLVPVRLAPVFKMEERGGQHTSLSSPFSCG